MSDLVKYKINLSQPFSITLLAGYILFSIALILPVYYAVSIFNINKITYYYQSHGAELPSLTKAVLITYDKSYLLIVAVVLFASLAYIKNRTQGISLLFLVLLNVSLALCVIWSAIVMLAIQLPYSQVVTTL